MCDCGIEIHYFLEPFLIADAIFCAWRKIDDDSTEVSCYSEEGEEVSSGVSTTQTSIKVISNYVGNHLSF